MCVAQTQKMFICLSSCKMSELYHVDATPQHICWDRKYYSNFEDQLKALKNSRTVYVGNLSFFTTESQILETFSVVGPVKRLIMGLNNITNTPCGFCFIEYYTQEHTAAALKYISDTICDDRVIRCDADGGFRPGRQFGRGRSGGQIRDERRTEIDPARGGVVPILEVPVSLLGKTKRDRDSNDNNDKRHDRNNNQRGNNHHEKGERKHFTAKLQTGLSAPRA